MLAPLDGQSWRTTDDSWLELNQNVEGRVGDGVVFPFSFYSLAFLIICKTKIPLCVYSYVHLHKGTNCRRVNAYCCRTGFDFNIKMGVVFFNHIVFLNVMANTITPLFRVYQR